MSTRLDQAVVELQIEFRNTMSALLWGMSLVAAAFLALGFLGLMIVLAFRETHPLLAAAAVATGFAAVAAFAAMRMQRALRSQGSAIAGLRHEVSADLSTTAVSTA